MNLAVVATENRNDVLGRPGAEIALQSSLELRPGDQVTRPFSLASSHWIQAAFSFKLNSDATLSIDGLLHTKPTEVESYSS